MNHIKNHIREDYTMIPNKLIRQVGLNPLAKYIYSYLASMSDDWTFLTPSLCKKLGMNEKTYVKYRNQLINEGWLFIEPQQRGKNGIFLPKTYHILNKQDPETPVKTTDNHFVVHGSHPSTTASVTDGFRDGRNGSHKKKKVKEEKEIKKEKSFLKNDFENFNPNPRLN
jgi:hypothetical protein